MATIEIPGCHSKHGDTWLSYHRNTWLSWQLWRYWVAMVTIEIPACHTWRYLVAIETIEIPSCYGNLGDTWWLVFMASRYALMTMENKLNDEQHLQLP